MDHTYSQTCDSSSRKYLAQSIDVYAPAGRVLATSKSDGEAGGRAGLRPAGGEAQSNGWRHGRGFASRRSLANPGAALHGCDPGRPGGGWQGSFFHVSPCFPPRSIRFPRRLVGFPVHMCFMCVIEVPQTYVVFLIKYTLLDE